MEGKIEGKGARQRRFGRSIERRGRRVAPFEFARFNVVRFKVETVETTRMQQPRYVSLTPQVGPDDNDARSVIAIRWLNWLERRLKLPGRVLAASRNHRLAPIFSIPLVFYLSIYIYILYISSSLCLLKKRRDTSRFSMQRARRFFAVREPFFVSFPLFSFTNNLGFVVGTGLAATRVDEFSPFSKEVSSGVVRVVRVVGPPAQRYTSLF